ncbi:MAG: DUF11 domain-containing protein [Rhodobacteraceae bacterium]|nr:DUF11 domain-containing protein [Paracoccaceae bacterium]
MSGGGGGAGGVRQATDIPVLSGAHTVVVGTGGTGGTQNRGANGGNSTFSDITAIGGGGGGGSTFDPVSIPPTSGGSGGGGGGRQSWNDAPATNGADGTTAQGNSGGDGRNGSTGGTQGANAPEQAGGGGGGAGGPGGNGLTNQGGTGGAGITSFITGLAQGYGGGGGGGHRGDTGSGGSATHGGGTGAGGISTAAAGNGTANTGGGGGGAGRGLDQGGNGGSGVVVIRYLVNTAPKADAGAPQSVTAFTAVSLDGSASVDVDDNIISYHWTQSSGTSVALLDGDTATPGFTAPQPTGSSETLVFQLTVTDAFGLTSVDTVTITLQGVAELTATKRVAVFSENGNDCADLNATAPPEPMTPAAIPGACIEYEIDVENTGPVAAQGISLVDELPASLRYQNAQLGGDWGAGTALTTPNCPEPGCEIRVDDGVLAAGATATITIRATIN